MTVHASLPGSSLRTSASMLSSTIRNLSHFQLISLLVSHSRVSIFPSTPTDPPACLLPPILKNQVIWPRPGIGSGTLLLATILRMSHPARPQRTRSAAPQMHRTHELPRAASCALLY